MKTISLNGKWKLWYYESEHDIAVTDLAANAIPYVDATVPGNVELDLSAAGILPADLFKGMNITEAEKFETYSWVYETSFETPKDTCGKRIRLAFGGVDCFAEYWLNGQLVGRSSNAMIEHEFDVTDYLNHIGANTLFVKIGSPLKEAYAKSYDMYSANMNWKADEGGFGIRKPPHCYGWDIMPRAVSAGLWRDVELQVMDEIHISQTYFITGLLSKNTAHMRFCYELDIPFSLIKENIEVVVRGKCGNSTFEASRKAHFKVGNHYFDIPDPKLWWPNGYGEPNVYDAEIIVLLNGEEVTRQSATFGIRIAELLRTDTTDGINGDFRFRINGTDIMCRGTNWVPLDAYHSRDAERYDDAIALVKDVGCNIVRCWGGNVYEDHKFFDLCDRNGIMVWQDFAMACAAYPQDADFLEQMRIEATSVVRKLRNHPSIILWSGDNECDQLFYQRGQDPEINLITRKILPEVIKNNQLNMPYIASSPYISTEVCANRDYASLSEDHTWGTRDYFKSSYYTSFKAHFVSECGYHGCPSVESIKKFIDEDYVWPCDNNEQWILHSSDQKNDPWRVVLMLNQIKQLFGDISPNLEEFVLFSQVSQAEAKKFFIENVRRQKPVKTGIIWWNLLDGWPQMSDAVVDYYFDKKLAYHYIKNSQQPFCIMCGELTDWNLPVYAVNDTLEPRVGTFSVRDGESGEVLAEGDFSIEINGNERICDIPIMYSEQRLLLLTWEENGVRGFNHYICGTPPFSAERYKKWLEIIRQESGFEYAGF